MLLIVDNPSTVQHGNENGCKSEFWNSMNFDKLAYDTKYL